MRIHVTSLGCPRNWVDTEQMITFLLEEGHELTAEQEKADIFLVNTCAFLQKAREEAIVTIENLLKKKKKSAKVIVTGCMIAQHKAELKKKFQEKIHFYLGAGDIDQILLAVHSKKKGEIISRKRSFTNISSSRIIATPSHYAYVKIAEGCSKNCSFCIIPKIKGPLISRTIASIIQEIKILLEKGVKEIILIAQDLADFGKDRKEKNELCRLIKSILKIKKDFWLRLFYVYPDDIPLDLIEIMASDSRICPYIDMPIQHISDKILRRMKRKTTQRQIEKTIEKLQKKIPDIAIRTSLIVGFPSETQNDFQKLISFLKKYELDHVGIFLYSREKLSSSYNMSGQIPRHVKEERAKILTNLQLEINQKKNKKKVGEIVKVIIDGYHPESSYLAIARSQKQAPEVDSQIIINDISPIKKFGEFAEVQITEMVDFDFLGRIQ